MPPLPGAAERSESATPPSEFDGFRVVSPLGRGGMGQVYLGHDTILDRPVALKFIAAEDPGPVARERFLVEARAIARLQHPNVVGIFRIGEVGGRPYIAYEFIAGTGLDRVTRPLPWQEALAIGVGLARGLSAAHRRDVLHRDVKPSNILIAEGGEVKLLDFGLAKLVDPGPPLAEPGEDEISGAITMRAPDLVNALATMLAENARLTATADGTTSALTATGALLGTPLYMAPELWTGSPASPQSDVFALGLVLYELLAGRLPHEDLRGVELARALLGRDLPPLGSAAAGVPAAFADVVDRCVRRPREERWASAEEVRDALEAIETLYRPIARGGGGEPLGTEEEVARVAASFARVAPHADAFSAGVYERLFEARPDLRRLFPAEMRAQRAKLVGALHVTIDNLRKPERVVPLLEDLGRRHGAWGVEPEHFEFVGQALLGALAEHDAACWTPETAGAWATAYGRIAEAMKRGLLTDRRTPAITGATPPSLRDPIEVPRTRYARSGEINVAYQVLGSGPIDLIVALGWVTHLDVGWQSPEYARFLRGLGSFARVLVLDRRGVGLSDRVADGASLEERMADIAAVMDAAGSERAVLFGAGDAAAPCALFAASYPERTRSIVLHGASARGSAAPDYPAGQPAAMLDARVAAIRAGWGEPIFLGSFAPSHAQDEAFRRFWAAYLRSGAGPGAAVDLLRRDAAVDVRRLLPHVRAPALVLHREGDRVASIDGGRWVADHLSGARWVPLPGADHLPWAGDARAIVDEVRRFIDAAPRRTEAHSWMLSTIVAFTSPALASGPAWERLALLCAREIARFHGLEIDGLGGSATAMFDGPARAVRFARAVLEKARELGVPLGAGIHVGECRIGEEGVAGEDVRLAPKVAALAAPGEILVTAALRDLAADPRLSFEAREALSDGIDLFAVR